MNAESRKSLAMTVLGIASGCIGLFGWLGIGPQEVGEAAYGFLRWLSPLLTFAAGVLVGKFASKFIAERRGVERRRGMAVRFAELEFGDKVTAVVAYDKGFVSCGGETSYRMWLNQDLREFVRRDTLEMGKARWYLRDDARKAIDENPWCIGSVREELGRKDAERGFKVAHNDEELLEIITQQWKGADVDSTWHDGAEE